MTNQFGGEWTEIKIKVFEKYLYSYMQIMKKRKWKLLYFDGFAGSGNIQTDDQTVIEGTAKHVLTFNDPRRFDLYYFVEKNIKNATKLQRLINTEFPELKEQTIVCGGEDCNQKLKDMGKFLISDKGQNYKAIAFLDPFGMQVKWEALESLAGLGVDLWILVPTGIGINRLLKNDEKSPKVWFKTLGKFFGIDPKEIEDRFYKEDPQKNLFGKQYLKVENSIEEACKLYQERMESIFTYVSKPLPLKNSNNTTLFHFIAASNASVAIKIANDIIRREVSHG